MNIFALDTDPKVAAVYHNNVHLVKMILETGQLLCGVHHVVCPGDKIPYKKTHINHPCAIWARKNRANYSWLVSLGIALCYEFEFRFGKKHKTRDVIEWAQKNTPELPPGDMTPFALAMPVQYHSSCPVSSYRDYYKNEKATFVRDGKVVAASWGVRAVPGWFK